ncbi:MAG: hypothetical protein ABJB03_00605 [Rhodoglobus sp.]
MTIAQLAAVFTDLVLTGADAHKEVLVKVEDHFRGIDTSYMDGTFILVAGTPVSQD